LGDTIKGFRDIVAGKYDHLPEGAFYMVGDISMVVKKAEEIAIEVARVKAQKGEDQDTGKKVGKKQEIVKKKIKETEDLLPVPKPTNTSEFIREKLKKIAEKCKTNDLARAAELSKTRTEGEIGVGWNFPSETGVREMWSAWDKKFDEQVDIEKTFADHFDALLKVQVEVEAKEAAEFAS